MPEKKKTASDDVPEFDPSAAFEVTEGKVEAIEVRSAPLPMSTGSDMVAALDAYQELQSALDAKMPDAIVEVHGRKFRKKVYWRTISRAFGLSVGEVAGSEQLVSAGDEDWGYKVTYRATSKSGDYADGDGACMASEKFGDGATVHNVRSHAHTRAFNRATSNLVGFGEVSADELGSASGPSGAVRSSAMPSPSARGQQASTGNGRGQGAKSGGGDSFIVESDIADVFTKDGTGKKGPWKMYIIKLASGESGSTFKEDLGQHAESCASRGVKVSASFVRNGEYTNLVGLDEMLDKGEPDPKPDSKPDPDDAGDWHSDIPF
jgi:hypothetical protein